jgi:hypothetical protein
MLREELQPADQTASSNGEFRDYADARNSTARQILVDVLQALFKLSERFALRNAIRKLLEVAEPHVAIASGRIERCS